MEKNEHEHIVINFNLINDYDRLSRDEFYSEYRHRFPYIYRTEHPQWEDFNGIKYQYCVDGYLELDYIPRLIEDGHHRRRVLYHRGWLRRCIKPDITPDALFYNLAIDVKRFISEKRNIITANILRDIVCSCFNTSTDDLVNLNSEVFQRTFEKCSKKTLIIHSGSRNQIKANTLKKEIRWSLLDKAYNKEITFEENLEILNDSDFVIGKSALYVYCRNRNIPLKNSRTNKYDRFLSLHIEGLSVRDEQAYLKEHQLLLSLSTLQKYRKIYIEDVLKTEQC